MGQATFANNTTMKVNRAIGGATTVNANCYAVVSYVCTSTPNNPFTSNMYSVTASIQQYYGPGQSIPASISACTASSNTSNYFSTYTLTGGVEFVNSP